MILHINQIDQYFPFVLNNGWYFFEIERKNQHGD